jgi:glucose-1-phosphate adenylyltransferase
LHRHISRTYNFDNFHGGWVQVWAAEQTIENTDWYQGTADAVRKQILEIRSSRSKYVMILAGDHLYSMDYSKMVDFHIANGADITVAVQPVLKEDAFRFGILKRDEDGRITDFAEKPKDPELLSRLVSRDDPESPYLGSMGIYIFNIDLLADVLRPDFTDHKFDDFGGDIIPHLIRAGKRVFGYNFEGYWRDIGTIRTFYETNLELTEEHPEFDFFDPDHPIFTHPRYLPGSRVTGTTCRSVLLAEGCAIQDAVLEHSLIGLRSVIESGTEIKDTIVMGADWYGNQTNGAPLGIGRNCKIQGAIIDKNASIGDNVVIKPFPADLEVDHALYKVREGIVVIPKNTTIPAGTIIQP